MSCLPGLPDVRGREGFRQFGIAGERLEIRLEPGLGDQGRDDGAGEHGHEIEIGTLAYGSPSWWKITWQESNSLSVFIPQ